MATRKQWQRASTYKSWFNNIRAFASQEEAPERLDMNAVADEEVQCLILHPVSWPHQGPNIELYLAEEAIGLVKSMGWNVAKGPMWDATDAQDEDAESHEDESDPEYQEKLDELRHAFEGDEPMRFDQRVNRERFKKEGIQNGDYVYGPEVQGVFFENGVILDLDEHGGVKEETEWTDANLRESVARSSLVRCRKVSSSTFFTKGKLNELGLYIKEVGDINVVYVNSSLTAIQIKKLEKRWNDILLEREDRLRLYYLKSAQKQNVLSPTDSDTTSAGSDLEGFAGIGRKIRVIDRFGMILQIFAARATTQMAQLQIELAWLRYAKTLLHRGNTPSFGSIKGMFGGHLMRQEAVELEIKSAKGQGSRGPIGGAGETQLQMEQYTLKVREAKLNQALKQLQQRANHERARREQAHRTQPLVALIGYTNAGKSALTNLCTGAELESENLLFQTLNTTNRGYRMPNGQHAVMLDTVGFITDLPHGLVESFKATLQEIHFADVIVHVRDISHPQTQHQRDTVHRILAEIGVSDQQLREKSIEVWNKIDLVEDRSILNEQYTEAIEQQEQGYPIVMMSCATGENKSQLLDRIGSLTSKLMGKRLYRLEYPCEEHNHRLSWLYKHASITKEEDFEYLEDTISIKVLLDEVTYQRYLKEFEIEVFESSARRAGGSSDQQKQIDGRSSTQRASKGKKGMPPPGWASR